MSSLPSEYLSWLLACFLVRNQARTVTHPQKGIMVAIALSVDYSIAPPYSSYKQSPRRTEIRIQSTLQRSRCGWTLGSSVGWTEMPKRIPGISKQWSNYLTCVLLHMILPLLPLLFEAYFLQAYPTPDTLAITTALYAMSIGLSSDNKAMFGLCILIGVIFSVVYGRVATTDDAFSDVRIYAFLVMILVFLIHAGERYNKHVVDCRPYLDF